MIKYRGRHGRVERVDVVRETPKMVVISTRSGEVKDAKTCTWQCYRDTFEEAKNFVVGIEMDKVNELERSLSHANARLHDAISITED